MFLFSYARIADRKERTQKGRDCEGLLTHSRKLYLPQRERVIGWKPVLDKTVIEVRTGAASVNDSSG